MRSGERGHHDGVEIERHAVQLDVDHVVGRDGALDEPRADEPNWSTWPASAAIE